MVKTTQKWLRFEVLSWLFKVYDKHYWHPDTIKYSCDMYLSAINRYKAIGLPHYPMIFSGENPSKKERKQKHHELSYIIIIWWINMNLLWTTAFSDSSDLHPRVAPRASFITALGTGSICEVLEAVAENQEVSHLSKERRNAGALLSWWFQFGYFKGSKMLISWVSSWFYWSFLTNNDLYAQKWWFRWF